MKKFLCLILAALLCVSLFACQKRQEPTPTGEAVTPLPDENNDGVPDVPKEAAAVIYLTINPEIAVFVDGSEHVIAVEFLNEDAAKAYGDLKLIGLPYAECTGMLVEAAIEKQYLKADGKVQVEVSALTEALESAKISKAVEEQVLATASKQELTVTVDASDVKEPGRILCWECLGSGECPYCKTCEPCEACEGSGIKICEACEEGYNECLNCHGASSTEQFITVTVEEDVEYCTVCGHKRSEEDVLCPLCNGTGRQPCHMCKGAGRLLCTQCNGNAITPCPFAGEGGCQAPGCNGSQHICTNCNGTGLKDCNECEDGTEPCRPVCPHPGDSITTRREMVEKEIDNPEFCVYCGGTGRHICNVCNGEYEQPCEFCDGTGTTPCGMCPTEKGICEMCHGSGMIDP